MGSTATDVAAAADEEAYMYALSLASSFFTSPMRTLKTAIELGLLEALQKDPAASLSPEEVVARLPVALSNPYTAATVDRILLRLSGHDVVRCDMFYSQDGKWSRRYAGKPLCEWLALTPNEDGIPFTMVDGMKVQVLQSGATDKRVNHSVIIAKKLLEFFRTRGFEGVGTLVDVGGGTGSILHAITSQYPLIKGVNLDLPHVISEAPPFPGVQHVGGDMLKSVPAGDAIIMKWILHDLSDARCATILKNCYEALPDNGKVIIVESILPVNPEATPKAQGVFHVDMTMLAHTPGGKERYERELEDLAKGVGFSGFKTIYNIYANEWVTEVTK